MDARPNLCLEGQVVFQRLFPLYSPLCPSGVDPRKLVILTNAAQRIPGAGYVTRRNLPPDAFETATSTRSKAVASPRSQECDPPASRKSSAFRAGGFHPWQKVCVLIAPVSRSTPIRLALLALTLLAAVVLALLAPPDAVLGERVRLVYFHGAWVWTGKVAFALSALAGALGLAGLFFARPALLQHAADWSRAFALAGLFIWLTYLPMSLVVQMQSWGGISWDEPRWRIPLSFGVAALLLQGALALFRTPFISCVINLFFGVGLWLALQGTGNVLHPDSPVFQSGSARIIAFFLGLLALCLLFMLQLARVLHRRSAVPAGEG